MANMESNKTDLKIFVIHNIFVKLLVFFGCSFNGVGGVDIVGTIFLKKQNFGLFMIFIIKFLQLQFAESVGTFDKI